MESVTKKNPFITVVIGDFNGSSSKWWTDDKTTQEDLNIETLLSQFTPSQVINKPAHISKTLTRVLICFLQMNKS